MTVAGIATHTRRLEMSLTDRDDRRHALAPTPLARESLIFLLFLPEEHLGCIAYTWVNGEGMAGSMVLVFGAENEQLFKAYVENVPMSKGADFTDWKVGALGVKHGAHHDECVVTFAKDDFALDYRFTAMTPPFTYHHNADGCPPFLADNRLEQSGWVKGSITVKGRRIPFDTTGHRDHSWGTRDWTAFHHYKWINVQTPAGACVNLIHGLAVDQLWTLGYVQKDGKQSPIASIKVHLERDAKHYSTTSGEVTLVDELDRTTEIVIGPRTALAVWPAGGLESHDSAGYGTLDGAKALVHVEEGWNPEYVERRKVILTGAFATREGAAVLSVNRGVGAVHGS